MVFPAYMSLFIDLLQHLPGGVQTSYKCGQEGSWSLLHPSMSCAKACIHPSIHVMCSCHGVECSFHVSMEILCCWKAFALLRL